MPARKKKQNAFVRYFTPFGLRQLCEMVLLLAAVITILGLALLGGRVTSAVLPIGLILFIIGGLIAVVRAVLVLTGGVNRRSPEFKRAIVNIIIMGLVVAMAALALFWFFYDTIGGV